MDVKNISWINSSLFFLAQFPSRILDYFHRGNMVYIKVILLTVMTGQASANWLRSPVRSRKGLLTGYNCVQVRQRKLKINLRNYYTCTEKLYSFFSYVFYAKHEVWLRSRERVTRKPSYSHTRIHERAITYNLLRREYSSAVRFLLLFISPPWLNFRRQRAITGLPLARYLRVKRLIAFKGGKPRC